MKIEGISHLISIFSNKFCFAEHGRIWYQKMQHFMDNLINKMKYHMKEIFNYNYTE